MSGLEIKWPNWGLPNTPQMNHAKKVKNHCWSARFFLCAHLHGVRKIQSSLLVTLQSWLADYHQESETQRPNLPPGAIHYQAFIFHCTY